MEKEELRVERAGEEGEEVKIRRNADSGATYGAEILKSQRGVLVTLSGGPMMMWNPRRQHTVAQSITEAEYIAYS